MTPRLEFEFVADKSLRAAARFWFGRDFDRAIRVRVFCSGVLWTYGLRGDFQAWNRVLAHEYETGATKMGKHQPLPAQFIFRPR